MRIKILRLFAIAKIGEIKHRKSRVTEIAEEPFSAKNRQVLIWTEGYDSLTKSYTDGAEVNLLPRKEHTYTNLVMKAF